MEDIEDMFKNDEVTNERIPESKRKMVRKNNPKKQLNENTQEDGIVIKTNKD